MALTEPSNVGTVTRVPNTASATPIVSLHHGLATRQFADNHLTIH